MKNPLQISASTLVSSMGTGLQTHLQCLNKQQTGLKQEVISFAPKLNSYYGEVTNIEDIKFPTSLSHYQCRNNQLAWLALQTDHFIQAVENVCTKYGSHRVGVALGTSTSGILETEQVLQYNEQHHHFHDHYHYPETHRMDSLAIFCAKALKIEGYLLKIESSLFNS